MPAILLIEDDPDSRAAMAEILGGAGFRVIASDEGRKALELAPVTRPAVVVLDLGTEGMNGWQFLERRRDEPSLARVPVVVVTGARSAPPDVEAVLRKPVSPGALLRVVRALAERPR